MYYFALRIISLGQILESRIVVDKHVLDEIFHRISFPNGQAHPPAL